MHLFLRKVADSRNCVFRVPRPDWRLGTNTLPQAEERAARMRAEFYGLPTGIGVRLGGGAVAGGILGYLMYDRTLTVMGPRDARAAVFTGVLVGLGIGWGIFRLSVRPADMHRVAALCTEYRICLVCGYDLSAHAAVPDGCTECPECGAAWALPPVMQPETTEKPS